MKVLVAVADHDFGYLLADFVVNHKWPSGAEIKILHVVQSEPKGGVPGPFYPEYTPEDFQKLHMHAAKLVDDIRVRIEKHLDTTDLKIDCETRTGNPKDEIMDISAQWAADLIVMGSHGRSGISRFMLGSVSHSVMTHVPCSVIIIKKPQRKY